jgi:hypothetical protein
MNDLYEEDLNNLKHLSERRETSLIERKALINFYENLNGDFWLNNHNWGIKDPCKVLINKSN